MINNVVLVGRMTRDAELRYTPSNQAVATFTLAVNRNFKNQNGEREADFINVVIWRQQAENLANWAKKGALIGITGRIQTRNYENQQGQRVYVTEVVAENFQLLESRTAREGQSGSYQTNNNFGGNASGGDNSFGGGFPSGGSQSNATPNFGRDESPFGATNPMDISDDDLPF
ncbi:single-stranded DNA-binding protein [Enterococcus faecalis]|nr:single-stranded DNA-binding protein [Enterococcus faecalis]